MNPRNYQQEMEQICQENPGRPTLLLHACCAPCSSYCLEALAEFFDITLFYYNPNVAPQEEYHHRVQEEIRLLSQMPLPFPVHFLEGNYEPERYYKQVEGLEGEPEGGARCTECFRLRLGEAAREAKKLGLTYVTTTLTISPQKDPDRLNAIGEEEAKKAGVLWLPSEFRKKGGYQRSILLSREYGLYRQNHCGCIFSQEERRSKQTEKETGTVVSHNENKSPMENSNL